MIRPKQSNIIDITFTNFKSNVMESKKPVVIKFYSNGCHLCRSLKPIYERLSEEYENQFVFGRVDTNRDNLLSRYFKPDGVPEIFIVNPMEDGNKRTFVIPYPKKPDPRTGFTESYLKQQFDKYINQMWGIKWMFTMHQDLLRH